MRETVGYRYFIQLKRKKNPKIIFYTLILEGYYKEL